MLISEGRNRDEITSMEPVAKGESVVYPAGICTRRWLEGEACSHVRGDTGLLRLLDPPEVITWMMASGYSRDACQAQSAGLGVSSERGGDWRGEWVTYCGAVDIEHAQLVATGSWTAISINAIESQ